MQQFVYNNMGLSGRRENKKIKFVPLWKWLLE